MWHRKSTSIFGIITLVSMVLVLRARTTYSKETRHRYATLISDLEDLEHFEHKFAQNLTHSLIDSKLLSSRSKIRRFVHAYLVDFYQSSGYAKTEHVMGKETTGASNNPICAYRIIRRTTFLLKPLITRKDFLLKFGSLRRGLVKFFWSNGWPIFKDYEIAAEKLLTLQLVHNLEAEKMALGSISNVYSNCSLNSIHCYETGNIALRSKGFALALEWFELAKQKALIDKKASVAFIELLIWTATDGHNLEFREKKKNLGPNLYNRKIRYIPGDSKRAQKVRNIQYNKFKGKRHKSYDEFNYWGLCSGENFQTDEEKSFLFCWLEFKLHPGLTIGPLKMEFLARNPDIVQAYEILQDKQLETINSDARKIVDSSVLLRANSFRSTRFNNLTNAAVIAWSEGTEGHVLSEKVQQLSGLKDISPEMQIESYSFGGHYLPGNDTVHNDLSSTDADPIMSLIFHINTVGHGGYVAFPSLGVAAKPVKGAVISWYNQFPDGSPDLFTNHGSCPVLLGQKWVATKWISLKERFLEQKCGLNPNERFQFPVNNKYLGTPMVTKMDEEILPSPKFPHADTALLAKYSFVSPSGLRALVQFEWSLYPRIKYMYHKYRNQTKGTFREEYDRQNKDVSKYLEEFEKFTGRILGNLDSILNADNKTVEKVALSPLAAYKTTTRFMHYIQNWFRRKPSAKNKLMIRISSYLAKVYNITDGPLQSDLQAAMFSVWYIQYIHNMDFKDMTDGIVTGIETGVTLNARDCLNIANHSHYYSDDPDLDWVKHAFYLVNNNSDDSVKYEEAYDALATSQLDYDCKFRPNNPICRGYVESKYMGHVVQTDFLDMKLKTMCRGKNLQTAQEKSKLFCWYEREIHPSYKIGPIKAEWLSLHPKTEVVQFYDIITDRVMDSLRYFAYDNATRDGVMVEINAVVSPLERQIIFAFPDPETNEESMYVSQLAERTTGLKLVNKTGGVSLRLTGYGPGGHRGKHLDAPAQTGTFMIYINDVKKGGETTFLTAGVSALPIKGSAVFWYNVFTDGTADKSFDHGGCPIVFGEKWVAVRWIVDAWQDHLKCDLKPQTPYEILVNGKSKYK